MPNFDAIALKNPEENLDSYELVCYLNKFLIL